MDFTGVGPHSAFGDVQDLSLRVRVQPDDTIDISFSDRETLLEGQLDLELVQICGLAYNGTLDAGKDGDSQGNFELEKLGGCLGSQSWQLTSSCLFLQSVTMSLLELVLAIRRCLRRMRRARSSANRFAERRKSVTERDESSKCRGAKRRRPRKRRERAESRAPRAEFSEKEL